MIATARTGGRLAPASLLAAALLLLLTAPALQAQETLVPLDRDGQVEEIDRDLARRLGLFLDEYPDMQVVRLYEVAGDDFVLEVTFRRDDRTSRQRVRLTGAEAGRLRDRVTAALVERAPEVALDQDGRFLLLGSTTLLGLQFYGWAVPVMLDVNDGRVATALYMFTAGASFILPYLYTRDRPVTYGMANAGYWGATRGASHGVFLANVLDDTPSEQLALGLGLAASLAEGLAAYNWALDTDMSAGRAHTIGNFGDFGLGWSGALLAMAQPDSEPLGYATLLAGSTAGLVAGTRLAPRYDHTWGDAEIQRTGVFLGAANAGVAWDWVWGNDASDDDARILGAAMLAGSVLGLHLVDRRLQRYDFTAGQGILVDLGTVAGGLLGLGFGVLVAPDDADATPYISLAALGANLGFLATFASLSDDARADSGLGRLELDLNPGALLLLETGHGHGAADLPVPLASLRYRF